MRKIAGWVLAMGLVVGMLAGCGITSKNSMVSKLQTEAEKLDATNYQSTAIMTVQMDNSSQKYYVETYYEAPDMYRIALGDSNKQINQIIVRNQNGMFIVSPALQKVFRFNGNWAQNQGHIYLYDQILQQIVSESDVKMTKNGNLYSFVMPVSPENDVVAKEQVEIDDSLAPKKVVMFDKANKVVVTMEFTSFKKNVSFQTADFDPQKLAESGAKTTFADSTELGIIEPTAAEVLGDKLDLVHPESPQDTIMRYTGEHNFTLEEYRPSAGVDGAVDASLVDLFGVPAVYTGSGTVHELMWLNNNVEFTLTSSDLSLGQMQQVAVSTFAQTGK